MQTMSAEKVAYVSLLFAVLTGCGGGGAGGSVGVEASPAPVSVPAPAPTITSSFAIGGSIAGFGGASGLVLANIDTLYNVPDGSSGFILPKQYPTGSKFDITVATQPNGLNCSVSDGSGNVGTSPVNSITIICKPESKYASVTTYVTGSNINTLVIDFIGIDRFSSIFFYNQPKALLQKTIGPNVINTLAGNSNNGLRRDGQGSTANFGLSNSRLTLDKNDNVYLCDGKIRKINPEGFVSTIDVNCFSIYAVDASGNIYIDEGKTSGSFIQISKVTLDGKVSVFANSAGVASSKNGPALEASFGGINTIIFDRQGNMLISDSTFNLIRKISTDGIVTTFAGIASTGFTRQSIDGPPGVAQFSEPMGLALDDFGNLYVGERARIRKVAPDGSVSTILGSNLDSLPNGLPRNGTHPNATLCFPVNHSLALKTPGLRSGILYFSDCGNQVREILLP